MSGTAKAITHIDNARVIVTEYRFAPGANTGWHRHGHDYVVVPLMDGKVRLETKTGTSFAESKPQLESPAVVVWQMSIAAA